MSFNSHSPTHLSQPSRRTERGEVEYIKRHHKHNQRAHTLNLWISTNAQCRACRSHMARSSLSRPSCTPRPRPHARVQLSLGLGFLLRQLTLRVLSFTIHFHLPRRRTQTRLLRSQPSHVASHRSEQASACISAMLLGIITQET